MSRLCTLKRSDQIRHELPRGLGDQSAKVQTAVGLVVASIAKWDVPEEWPQLLPALLGVIQARTNDIEGRMQKMCKAEGWQMLGLDRLGSHFCANAHACSADRRQSTALQYVEPSSASPCLQTSWVMSKLHRSG